MLPAEIKMRTDETGEAAKRLIDQMTDTHVFLTADGRMAAGQAGVKFCTFTYDSLAYDAGMPERSITVRTYDSPEERAEDLNERGAASAIHSRGWAIKPIGQVLQSSAAEDMGGHLLVAARRWMDTMATESVDLASLTEGKFELGLLEALKVTCVARRQVTLKGSSSRAPVLSGWPGVGGLDIEIQADKGVAWAELKWAKSSNVLHNCLWDAAKVARAVRDGVATSGYLVAGAPVSVWAENVDYAGVFDFSGFSDDSIMTKSPRFESCWRKWNRENVNTYPVDLPTPICTWPEGEVKCENEAGEPWAIRVARVTAPGVNEIDAAVSPRHGENHDT